MKHECFKYLADNVFLDNFKSSNISKKTQGIPSSFNIKTHSVPSSSFNKSVASSYIPIIKKNSRLIPLSKIYFFDNINKSLKLIKKPCSCCLQKWHSVNEIM